MEVIHYTSIWNWLRIKWAKEVRPHTRFLGFTDEKMVESRPDLLAIQDKRFLLGIPLERVDDWKEYGLYDKLRKTTGEAELRFPLEDLEGVMVRDIFHTTSARSREVYRYDVYGLLLMGYPYPKELKKLYADYLQSSRPLREVDLREIRVPELWIPHSVPIARVTKRLFVSY